MQAPASSLTRFLLKAFQALGIYIVVQYVVGFAFGYSGAPKGDAIGAAFYTSILMAGVSLFVRWPWIDG